MCGASMLLHGSNVWQRVAGEEFEGAAVIITVPLGCLKTGDITFDPPLPPWKAAAVANLGFGDLNKVHSPSLFGIQSLLTLEVMVQFCPYIESSNNLSKLILHVHCSCTVHQTSLQCAGCIGVPACILGWFVRSVGGCSTGGSCQPRPLLHVLESAAPLRQAHSAGPCVW